MVFLDLTEITFLDCLSVYKINKSTSPGENMTPLDGIKSNEKIKIMPMKSNSVIVGNSQEF